MAQKILAINASPRIGNTNQLLKRIEPLLEQEGFTVETIHLSQAEIKPCTGCTGCVLRAVNCWQKDGMQNVLEKMREADGIIFAAPVYMFHASYLFKLFIDRTVAYFHRPDPRLVGKPVLCVSTGASPMQGKALGYMSEIAYRLGMNPSGKISQIGTAQHEVKPKQLKRFIRALRAPRGQYRPTFAQLFNFLIQKGSAMTFSEGDRAHFTAQGWDRQIYYYDCRVALHQRALIGVVSGIMSVWARNAFKEVD
ncbi:MAG: NAD(P)H-dependent oxidoreductase [Anaerolineaceae bacterium]|nr:NAD(P)H-dependent oxidoreductase [Anaerolineaceae bacterium]